MLNYIFKRFGRLFLVLFGASLLSYFLVVHSGDPLQDLRESTDADAEYQMELRAEQLNLMLPWTDQYYLPWYERYWDWLTGVLGCLDPTDSIIGVCDWGTTINGGDVTAQIANAAAVSLRLVLIATLLAIVLGVLTGIISALRQYSVFDYSMSFVMFLFWSLPLFWAAVIAKEYLAIRYNDWMADPHFAPTTILIVAVLLAIAIPTIIGGSSRRRIATGAVMFFYTCTVMPFLDHIHFMEQPRLGTGFIAIAAIVLAVGFTAMIAGIHNLKVLYCGLAVAALGVVSYFLTWNLMRGAESYLLPLGLFLLTIAICLAIGRIFGGYAKGQATAVTVLTGILISGIILLDHYMYTWPGLLSAKPRPIRTVGASTPNLRADDFWVVSLDQLTQLWLPTLVIMLTSLATYTRYTRSSMLEVIQQDYIRTARAKGVTERTVVLKHAFRNAMIPLATLVAFDFAGLIGGAIIVERVFGWNSMGTMFITGLSNVDPAPVMAVIVFTGGIAVLFNFIADILYAVLDPRIRV
ncbi:ABC transporter permease [Nesterenkonia haasae]|uniref:ABC transporter permease n=1 Tax=Nesterenkonia haasae TaxID=2587813 RepID=UPI001391A527|nr:ABC transporter permease [Nesterenkonia haasae]NDK31311.1 ABC transporter permease [Nesterenkonia haasae]